MAKVIVAHTPEHAQAALQAASQLQSPLTLQSAPDAIFYAGSLYLLSMFEQAKAAYPDVNTCFILDCADAGAEAVEAMRTGWHHLRSSAPDELREKLANIARSHGVTMHVEAYEALDLHGVRDTKAACAQWLREQPHENRSQ